MSGFWKYLRAHKIIIAVVIILVGGMGWLRYEYPSASWRYKLTVTVETPEGIKTGTVVRETRASMQIRIGDCCSGGAGTVGEALVVDLGERGVLFGLTEELDPVSYVIGKVPAATREGMDYYKHLKDAKADLLAAGYNLQFVKFTDLNDPMTVESVDIRDLSVSFGDGVRIKDFTIETTDDPVTIGVVNEYLPWLAGLNGGYLSGKPTGRNSPLGLHAGNFQKGVHK